MKNRTKGILMFVIFYVIFLLSVSYLIDSYIPAFIFGSVFVCLYLLKADELINSDD